MITAVIVEDETHNSEALKSLVREGNADIQIVGEAKSVDDAVALIKKVRPYLVFMDIEIKNGTGFDVLGQLSHLNFEIIFTTAFEHYALRAIKFSSLDYLLKPLDREELMTSIEKAKRKKSEEDKTRQLEMLLANFDQKSEQQNICLSTADGIEFVKLDSILYCEANGSYTNFIFENKQKLIVSKNLKEYESILRDHDFMRVHNSFLISLKKVKKYVKSDGGYILMNNGDTVSISPKRKDDFLLKMASLR